MPTRMERLEESLKKERHKADIKRLKKAKQYLELGMAVLKDSFHDFNYNDLAKVIHDNLNEPMDNLGIFCGDN